MTNPLFFSTNGHYYQFVAASGITWQQAKTLAEAQTYNGMSGYLATVTTFAERNFIDGIVFGSGRPDNTYIGGSDANQEGVWRWVTGPEALENSGLGKLFYNQSTGTNYTDIPSSDLWIGGATPSGNTSTNDFLYMYSFFDPSFNPSNNSIGSPGSGGPAGYLIEYGGNTNTAPAITSAATASTAENVSTTTAIYTATATDPDAGATLTYSLSGGVDAALFNINASTGAVTFKASPNFEAPTDSGANNVYDITVQASDGALTASKAVAITVTDVFETPPTFKFTSSATLGVNENVSVGGSIYGAAASIPGVDGTVVYSVSGGADAASFAIDAATGALSFKYSPDYEAAGDAGANNVYELGLRAVETTAAPISAEIQIRNALWSAAGQVTAEVWAKASSLEGFDLVIGATGGSGLSFSQAALSGWTVMPNTTNEEVLVSGYSLAPLGTGPVLLGTISAQATGAEFHLLIKDGTDAQAAANMVKVTPYDIAFYQATQALAITVNNVNEAPVITSASSASTPENALTSQAVYTATATDPDANTTFTYSISGGADASLFQIDSHTGAVTFKASPDFEGPADAGTNNVYDITIRASDGVLYAEKAVAINVTDVLDSGSLHGETYFWKANASGQHALLSGVTVNAAGGNQPSEGGNAPIQLKNITWDVSGHATADIYAHVTGSADSFDLHLGFGGATGINFTLALSSDWTLLTNQVQNEYLISGYSMTPLGAGDVKLGSVAFETGQLAQTHIGVDAGSRMGSVTATAYGYSLAHDTSGSSGVYSITPRRQSSQARG